MWVSLAHSIARWSRCVAEDFPKLKDLLIDNDADGVSAQTEEQMEEAMRRLSIQNQGRGRRGKKN